jgi:hypothetical protein
MTRAAGKSICGTSWRKKRNTPEVPRRSARLHKYTRVFGDDTADAVMLASQTLQNWEKTTQNNLP